MGDSKWPVVKDNLNLIKKWAREGIRECDMCKTLGIGISTFSEYKHRYPELKDALKQAKQPYIADLEDALTKRALGFEYDEKKTVYKKDADGELIEHHEKTTKYFPPNVQAISILLQNKDRDENNKTKWSLNVAKIELEKENLELKKEIERLKNF